MNHMKSSTFLSRLTDVSSSDPDDARRRKLLSILLTGIAALSIITLVMIPIASIFSAFANPINFWIGLASATGLLLGTLIFYLINRNRRVPGWWEILKLTHESSSISIGNLTGMPFRLADLWIANVIS